MNNKPKFLCKSWSDSAWYVSEFYFIFFVFNDVSQIDPCSMCFSFFFSNKIEFTNKEQAKEESLGSWLNK